MSLIGGHMETKEIMTRKEAAAYIGISLASFAKIQKDIKSIHIGKSIRFRKDQIDVYLEKHSR